MVQAWFHGGHRRCAGDGKQEARSELGRPSILSRGRADGDALGRGSERGAEHTTVARRIQPLEQSPLPQEGGPMPIESWGFTSTAAAGLIMQVYRI